MMDDAKLQQALEHATAAHLPDDIALDAETANLREAWLTLGALLPPATQGLDETRILARINAAQHVADATPRTAPSSARPGHWLALATALLIVAGVVIVSRQPGAQPDPSKAQTPPPGAVASIMTWDDSLDEQLAAAQQTLAQLQTGWRSSHTDADNLGQHINDLLSDFESDTL